MHSTMLWHNVSSNPVCSVCLLAPQRTATHEHFPTQCMVKQEAPQLNTPAHCVTATHAQRLTVAWPLISRPLCVTATQTQELKVAQPHKLNASR